MSDEKLQSIAPTEGPQCSFEDQICLPPEAFYDEKEQICVDPGDSVAEYREAEKSKIADLDQKKALANKAKSFAAKPKIKKEEKKEVAPAGKPTSSPEIFRTMELSPERGGCVDAAPATAPAPFVLFSANLNFQSALFYFQDLLPNRETKAAKKKDRVVELENQPIEVACGDSDLAQAMIRDEQKSGRAQSVEIVERLVIGSRQTILASEVFPLAHDLSKAEIGFYNLEGAKVEREKEEKKGQGLQSAPVVLQEEMEAMPEISLRARLSENNPASGANPVFTNLLRQFFPADPAVSGLLVFPFALPHMEARGVVALDGRGVKMVLTKVSRGGDAHNSKGSGGQGGRGNSGQDKNRQRSFQ